MDENNFYVLDDNRVEFSDNQQLIIDQENETVSTSSRSSRSQMSSHSQTVDRSNVVLSDPFPERSTSRTSATGAVAGTRSRRHDVENGAFANHANSVDIDKHCHQQLFAPPDKSSQRQLMIAATMCLCFMIGECLGGYFADSLAVMTDAAHLLSDLASFLISLFAVWIARRPATKKLSFGYYRAEVLGAVVSIIIIWVLTGVLVYLAIIRIISKSYYNVDADIMLITSGIGVLFNVAMAAALTSDKCHIKHGHSHGGGAGHSHEAASTGHSHDAGERRAENGDIVVDFPSDDSNEDYQPTSRRISISVYPTENVGGVKKTKNINVRAAVIHVLGDFIQSVGVFIAAVIIKLDPNAGIADPICTFLFSVLVMFTTVTVLRDAVHVLMEGTPRDVDYNQVLTDLQTIEGVRAAHSLHMWSLTLDKAAVAVHLAIATGYDPVIVVEKASRMMRFKYSLMFVTIQVEPWDEPTMTKCHTCAGPLS